MLNRLIESFESLYSGGWVVAPLLVLSMVLAFALVYRWLLLSLPRETEKDFLKLRTTHNLEKQISEILPTHKLAQDDTHYLYECLSLLRNYLKHPPKDLDLAMEAEVQSLKRRGGELQPVSTICIVVTPLLGLLGTVMGMIETFDSMADSALFSQSGGIAGGISQALITTEVGLVIAVPGLIVSLLLEGRQNSIDEMVDLLCERVKVELSGVNTLKGELS